MTFYTPISSGKAIKVHHRTNNYHSPQKILYYSMITNNTLPTCTYHHVSSENTSPSTHTYHQYHNKTLTHTHLCPVKYSDSAHYNVRVYRHIAMHGSTINIHIVQLLVRMHGHVSYILTKEFSIIVILKNQIYESLPPFWTIVVCKLNSMLGHSTQTILEGKSSSLCIIIVTLKTERKRMILLANW